MEDNQITIVLDDEEIIATILFTHYSEDTKNNYVVFDMGDDNISAAIYNQNESSEEGMLSDIETDEEWEMIEDLIEEYAKENEIEEE